MKHRRGQGEGAIYKREDGRWEGKVDLGWESGKRRRKSVYGKTRAEVQEKIRKTQNDKATGLPLLNERRTTGDYLEWWAAEVLPGTVKDSTADGYRWILSRYVLPHVGAVPLARLAPAHVQGMLRSLSVNLGLAPATVRQTRAILRRALGNAERWGYVTRNAAALVDAPRRGASKLDDVLNEQEAEILLAAGRGTQIGSIVSVVLAVGLRKGEALALRWNEIDLDAKTLEVRATLKRRTGFGLQIDTPKTEHGTRIVPLASFAVDALRDQRRRQIENRLSAGESWKESDYVFTSIIGTPVDPANISKQFRSLCIKAGIRPRRFHALRHSAATIMRNNGVSMEVISKMFGHAGYAITADIYARVLPSLQEEAANVMDSLFGASKGA